MKIGKFDMTGIFLRSSFAVALGIIGLIFPGNILAAESETKTIDGSPFPVGETKDISTYTSEPSSDAKETLINDTSGTRNSVQKATPGKGGITLGWCDGSGTGRVSKSLEVNGIWVGVKSIKGTALDSAGAATSNSVTSPDSNSSVTSLYVKPGTSISLTATPDAGTASVSAFPTGYPKWSIPSGLTTSPSSTDGAQTITIAISPETTSGEFLITTKCETTGGSSSTSINIKIASVSLDSDLNNDGVIDDKDQEIKQAGNFSEDEKEYLFVNDNMSNGLGDKDDQATGFTSENDDDILSIKLSSTMNETIWFEHPSIDKLAFYKAKTCLPSDKVSFPMTLSDSITLPEFLYVRAEGVFSSQISGDLIFKIGNADKSQTYASDKIPLTIVKSIGDAAFFYAVRNYILENNVRAWTGIKTYPGSNPLRTIRIVAMREEATEMKALDTYWRSPKLFQIGNVVASNQDATVVINGNFTFDIQTIAANTRLTRRCHGRLISGNTLNANVSSDNDDPNLPAPGDPLRGSVLAGDTGRYISMKNKGAFEIRIGRVPNDSGYKEAMGGFHTNYTQGNQDQMIGIAKVGSHRMLFTATVINGTGATSRFAADAKKSGILDLPGGEAGKYTLILGDAGTSLAVAIKYSDNGLRVNFKSDKHDLWAYTPFVGYCINTYVLFYADKPRN